MGNSPYTRHKVVLTMTRGDEGSRRLGDLLWFEGLGGMVRVDPHRSTEREAALATGGELWAIRPLRKRLRSASRRETGQLP